MTGHKVTLPAGSIHADQRRSRASCRRRGRRSASVSYGGFGFSGDGSDDGLLPTSQTCVEQSSFLRHDSSQVAVLPNVFLEVEGLDLQPVLPFRRIGGRVSEIRREEWDSSQRRHVGGPGEHDRQGHGIGKEPLLSALQGAKHVHLHARWPCPRPTALGPDHFDGRAFQVRVEILLLRRADRRQALEEGAGRLVQPHWHLKCPDLGHRRGKVRDGVVGAGHQAVTGGSAGDKPDPARHRLIARLNAAGSIIRRADARPACSATRAPSRRSWAPLPPPGNWSGPARSCSHPICADPAAADTRRSRWPARR